jgi:hypothetical protein
MMHYLHVEAQSRLLFPLVVFSSLLNKKRRRRKIKTTITIIQQPWAADVVFRLPTCPKPGFEMKVCTGASGSAEAQYPLQIESLQIITH